MTRLVGYNWNGPQSHLGPWLFWSPRNMGPKKVGPRMKTITLHGAQISQGPNEIGDHFSYRAHISKPNQIMMHNCQDEAFKVKLEFTLRSGTLQQHVVRNHKIKLGLYKNSAAPSVELSRTQKLVLNSWNEWLDFCVHMAKKGSMIGTKLFLQDQNI